MALYGPTWSATTILLLHLELAAKPAILEKRMKTMRAEYKTDIARLTEDNAKLDAEAARRQTRLIVAIAGLLAFAVAVLGLLIRWPE